MGVLLLAAEQHVVQLTPGYGLWRPVAPYCGPAPFVVVDVVVLLASGVSVVVVVLDSAGVAAFVAVV
jgi:hypothetical protein